MVVLLSLFNVSKANFELILNHENMANGMFSSSILTTGVENEDNPSANTYSIIDNFDESIREKYKTEDDKYRFKLAFHYDSYPDHISEWKQSSWITESTITGVDLYGVDDAYPGGDSGFYGVGLNTHSFGYLDGNPGSLNFW